jgi:acyl-coenzyme A thioesterase PaaI-like protein
MAQQAAQQMAKDLINQTEELMEDFSNSGNNEEESSSLHSINENNEDLKTHDRIRSNLCGNIVTLEQGYSKITFQTTKEMVVDDMGLVHSGFIFGAADYAACVAVNESNVVIIGSRSKFLAPAKVNDLIEFEAKAKFEDSRKREIKVSGYINEIKVYEGVFQAVVLENHIFKTKIKHLYRNHTE